MNEWLRRLLEQIKGLWARWTATQKIILFSVLGVAILAIVLIVVFSAAPTMVPLIGVPITDENNLNRIISVLDQEGVPYKVSAQNMVYVEDQKTARRIRTTLVREDLIPPETDPWAIFDVERFTITDFERDVNLQRAITKSVEQHILSLQGVDAVSVNLVIPKPELFTEDQKPVTASVIVTPSPGSDVTENRSKIQGMEKLIMLAVPGLSKDNIVITDYKGVQINDFTGAEEIDRIEMARRELKTKKELEQQYKTEILNALKGMFGPDRVQIIKIDMLLSFPKKTITTEEHFPITMKADNPKTPFDESVVQESLVLSKQVKEESFEGTGFNPEGPPGQEGQTPPAYKDLSNLVGKYGNSQSTQNNVVNTRQTQEQPSPWSLDRLTAAVAIDGAWKKVYNEQGQPVLNADGSVQRAYTPVSAEDLRKAEALVKDAVGYNQSRGDSVTVEHLQFDRSVQFAAEDAGLRHQRQVRTLIFAIIIGVAALIFAALMYRLIARELERRRRLREEELARQHQAMREAALRRAEEEGAEVELSVEERARLEMQENAVNMAREHPEDVAQLIRTWLLEE
jgi:flagellar M-ring protein FliF